MKTDKFFTLSRKKNRMYKLVIIVMLFSIAFGLNGCDDFTDVGMPVTELNATAVFDQKNTANAVVIDLYAKIRENGILTGKTNGISRELGLYTDELGWYGSSTATSALFYNNTVLPSTLTVANWWSHSYNQIYSANAVIEGVAASTGLEQSDKDQLTGEAMFVRGLLHFYLMQLYGDIPYITSTDYTINATVSRMPSVQVYEHIIADLTQASILLSETYLSTERVRPNSFAAQALLARVYLYKGDYVQAANAASAVLNNTEIYSIPDELNDVFLKGSTSTIWQFSPRSATRNTDEGSTFIFNSGPPPAAALSESLVAGFESGDQRKVKWIRSRTNGTSTWYHSYKYKKTTNSTPQLEYSIVLRLAELYLIRSEARAQQGDLIGASEDLNVIRNKAGLEDTPSVTQQEILDAILQERRVEFFTEYGHRFIDLKRYNKLDTYLSVKPSWQSFHRLLPLPQRELNLNPNLGAQNSGY